MQSKDNQRLVKTLNDRKGRLEKNQSRFQKIYYLSIAVTFLLLTCIGYATWYKWAHPGAETIPLIIFLITAYLPVVVVIIAMTRTRLRSIHEDIDSTEFGLDLAQYPATPHEVRAEKILHINQVQLTRYYNLNLSNNFWIFILGIFCILLG